MILGHSQMSPWRNAAKQEGIALSLKNNAGEESVWKFAGYLRLPENISVLFIRPAPEPAPPGNMQGGSFPVAAAHALHWLYTGTLPGNSSKQMVCDDNGNAESVRLSWEFDTVPSPWDSLQPELSGPICLLKGVAGPRKMVIAFDEREHKCLAMLLNEDKEHANEQWKGVYPAVHIIPGSCKLSTLNLLDGIFAIPGWSERVQHGPLKSYCVSQ